MVDEPITPAAPAASTLAAVPATDAAASAAPVAASNPESAPAQASTETPSAPPAAESSSAPAQSSALQLPATLLGAEPKVDAKAADAKTPEVKSAEGEKPAEDKKVEGDKSAEPAALPSYEPWVVPKGVKLDEKQSGEFNTLLGEFQNITKADQAEVQKFGQTLVDKHTAAVNETVGRVHGAYQQAWVKQTEDWKQSFVSDPEIGGKRQETTLASANEFIRTHGGTPEQQASFRKLMQDTGIGNHPDMIRILANAMSAFSEPKPVPAQAPVTKVSKSQKFYGKQSA